MQTPTSSTGLETLSSSLPEFEQASMTGLSLETAVPPGSANLKDRAIAMSQKAVERLRGLAGAGQQGSTVAESFRRLRDGEQNRGFATYHSEPCFSVLSPDGRLVFRVERSPSLEEWRLERQRLAAHNQTAWDLRPSTA